MTVTMPASLGSAEEVAGGRWWRHRLPRHGHEARELALEGDADTGVVGRAGAVLGHDEVGLALALDLSVHVRPMHQQDDVGVLLDGPGLAQVGELWLLV